MSGLAEKIDQETDRILIKLIDSAAKQAEEEIEKTGTLSMEHAIPLLLKSQYNHILHLDHELVAMRNIMDNRFGKMDERFGKMDERFSKMDERFSTMDERFGTMDERFRKMDERFGKMDERFGRMDENFTGMFGSLNEKISELYKWMFGCFIGTITVLGGLMTYLQFFVRK